MPDTATSHPPDQPSELAPGRPGDPPTWSSSVKDIVTTALGPSRLWATLGYGVVNEVYWPTTGQPQIRDLGFIVATPDGWHDVERADRYRLRTPAPYVPVPRIRHTGDDYRLDLEVVCDSMRDVLLVRYRLHGDDCRLYVLLAPHLGRDLAANDAWVEQDRLQACEDYSALSLACDGGFTRASAGYVGASDGRTDFARHGRMTWTHARAEHGNVALVGELAHAAGVLALGFANTPSGAEVLARSSLAEGFRTVRERTIAGWREWGERLELPEAPRDLARQAAHSAAVLKIHEDRTYPGAVVASLSVPWGSSHDSLGGYHLVWSRDAVEAGHGLLVAGQHDDARRMLAYLVATQKPEGYWSQNFYPDGEPFWTGIQLDEVGAPILLATKLDELGLLDARDDASAMVHAAAAYIAANGPGTPQDRWEENPGLNPFTLAIEIAALVAASRFLRGDERAYARSLADCWNARVEEWLYARGGRLAADHDVAGYYVHVAPLPADGGLAGTVAVQNHAEPCVVPADALVSLDFLYLVRLGLRRADDARVRHTLRVAEALLRRETPNGASYYRYRYDGYGEHADGSPYDGTGIGRLWPLLTGERGHLAVQCGESALPYLRTMARMSGPGGLIPEQVWDVDPIPERDLWPGRPTGSAMPLVWAHAEFLKLLAARRDGRPVELLDTVWRRHRGRVPRPRTRHWRRTVPLAGLAAGHALLVEDTRPFHLHVGTDGWRDVRDLPSRSLGLGMHGVRLPADALRGHAAVDFTFYFPDEDRWSGQDHRVTIGG
ncbi:MAG TPA: glycoside hydrolase family 15 protein [Gemmatimonadaceae bacterium]|nr:glycoside hydrolase family 15 protein [Gemmatimonadaceae bacterium]